VPSSARDRSASLNRFAAPPNGRFHSCAVRSSELCLPSPGCRMKRTIGWEPTSVLARDRRALARLRASTERDDSRERPSSATHRDRHRAIAPPELEEVPDRQMTRTSRSSSDQARPPRRISSSGRSRGSRARRELVRAPLRPPAGRRSPRARGRLAATSARCARSSSCAGVSSRPVGDLVRPLDQVICHRRFLRFPGLRTLTGLARSRDASRSCRPSGAALAEGANGAMIATGSALCPV